MLAGGAMMRAAAGALLAALAACTQFPDLDAVPARAERTADPRIVPLEPILALADTAQTAPDDDAALEARAADLRRKAAALRARSF